MANLSFTATQIDGILDKTNKATTATALKATDTFTGLADGLYTATAEVAAALTGSPTSAAFVLRVLASMYILLLADGSKTYIGTPGAWYEYSGTAVV